jgi:ATP-dependent helicase/nuclease subunit B
MEDADRLENYVLAYGIRGNKWLEIEPWKFINPRFGDELSEEEIEYEKNINEIRNMVREPLVKLKDDLKSSGNILDMVKAVYQFLVKEGAYDKIEMLVQKAEGDGNPQLQRENAQIWDIVMEVFDQMVEILGDEKVSIEEFYRIIKSGFEGTEMGIIPASLSQVLVGNLQRSRSHDIKALFLIGTNEGLFPIPVEDIGFITDNDKEFISAIGYEFIPDTKSKVFEDQFLIYSVVTRPSEFLHISYAMADSDGKALRPSIYLSKVKNIFPKLREKTDAVYTENEEENLEKISIKAPTFKYLIQNLRGYVDTKRIVPLWKDVYNIIMKNMMKKKSIP